MNVNMCPMYLLVTVTLVSIVNCEKCGYVRGPLAATIHTVIVNLDCSKSKPSSNYVDPLQLPNNATHVAVQLIHCPTVPVGLFTDVTDKLASVTLASEDAIHLFEGTFEGLSQITELRLLGFNLLRNLSRSVLEPLRNIETLILDGFGSDSIALPYLGSVIRKLSGTPIRRLVLNKIEDQLVSQEVLKIDNFKIYNASLKELIITDVPFSFEGSIRRAFPKLVCFCGGGRFQLQTVDTYPAIFDLIFMSAELTELVLQRSKDLPPLITDNFAFPITGYVTTILRAANLYPDLIHYLHNRTTSKACALGFIFKIGDNLSKIILNGVPLRSKTEKPICVQEDNNLVYLDFTGSYLPGTIPVLTGLKKLKYISLENTRIRKFTNTFLQYYPSLEVLKLSKLDIGDFIKNTDGDFFGSCPTITHIHLDDCNLTSVPTTLFLRSVNLHHLDMSQNYLRTFDFDVQNCTKLNLLNFSRNHIEGITQERINHLTQLALRKTGDNKLDVDLSGNRLQCLCNSTHFVKFLQYSPTESNIKLPGFDSYTCLYPNGSIVRVSEVVVSELEQECSVIRTLENGSDCPCNDDLRRRLQRVWASLDGLFCKNEAGDLVSMKAHQLPACFMFNQYRRASFIAPVVVGGILGIAMLIAVGLLIYYRKSRRVRQVRECLEMNPFHFVHTALQYVMMHNRTEEEALFRYQMFIFVQDDDQSSIHTHFLGALQRERSVITRDNFLPGSPIPDAMVESIRVCQWIVPVLTVNFLSDPVCVDFISRVQFSRPHALIPVVWEQPLVVTDVSIEDLLQTSEPLYWPGELATPEDRRNFWSSLLERTIPL